MTLEQQWIPVSERPPEIGESVRLYSPEFVDDDFNQTGSIEGYWDEDIGFRGAVWNGCKDCWDTKIVEPTHWMPLPAPPKESSDD